MHGHGPPDRSRLRALLDVAVTRGTTDRRALRALSARCWPGGSDRTHAAARHWVRLWGPRPVTVVPADCACALGRCTWCN